jgi:hypothetical protein
MHITPYRLKEIFFEQFYEKRYKGRCGLNYRIFSEEYFEKDRGLHRLPYFVIDKGTVIDILTNHKNKFSKDMFDHFMWYYGINKIGGHRFFEKAVLIAEPKLKEEWLGLL